MPPRISQCLESPVLHHVSAINSHHRRTLNRYIHHNFWSSTYPQSLPYWWDVMSESFVKTLHARDNNHVGFLEFLYPSGSLAFYNAFALIKSKRKATSKKRRSYSSIANSTTNQQYRDKVLHFKDITWTALKSSRNTKENLSFALLYHKFESIPSQNAEHLYEEAWSLYQKLQTQMSFDDLRLLMEHLSFSSRDLDRQRLLKLLDVIDVPETHHFWKATLLGIFVGDYDQAFNFYCVSTSEESKAQGIFQAGHLLLAHAIRMRNWQLASNIFYQASISAPINLNDKNLSFYFANLWNLSKGLPNRVALARECLEQSLPATKPQSTEPQSTEPQPKTAFEYQFVSMALAYARSAFDLNLLLPVSRSKLLEDPQIYMRAIRRFMEFIEQNPEQGNLDHIKVLNILWISYKDYCHSGDLDRSLTLNLFSTLVNTFTDLSWAQHTRELILDVFNTCEKEKISLPYTQMVNLMWYFARQGREKWVRLIESRLSPKLSDLQIKTRTSPYSFYDTMRMKSLLATHMVKGDTVTMREEFENISRLYPNASKNVALWEMLASGYSSSRNFSEAYKLVTKSMPDAGVTPTQKIIYSLLSCSSWSGDTSTVNTLIQIAEEYNIVVDTRMINLVVLTHLRQHTGPLAEELIELFATNQINIKAWDPKAASDLFNGVLYLVARRKDLRSAMRLYDYMLKEGVPRNTRTQETLIKVFASVGLPKNALYIFSRHIINENKMPTTSQFATVMKAFMNRRRYKEVILIRQEMAKRNATMDATTYHLYLLACAMKYRCFPTQDEKILKLLKTYLNKELLQWKHEFSPWWFEHHTDAYFACLIDAYAEIRVHHVVQAVQKMYLDYRASHSLPDVPSPGVATSFMKAAFYARNYDEVGRLWHQIISKLQNHNSGMHETFRNIQQSFAQQSSRKVSTSISGNDDNEIGQNIDSSEVKDGDILKSYATSGSQAEKIASENTNVDDTKADEKIARSNNEPQVSDDKFAINSMIDKPLSIYIDSLSAKGDFDEIPKLVEYLQNLGFVITPLSWTKIVPNMLLSRNPENIRLAFQYSEQHLMPFFPQHELLAGSIQNKLGIKVDTGRIKAMQFRQKSAMKANHGFIFNLVTIKQLRLAYVKSHTIDVVSSDFANDSYSGIRRLTYYLDKSAPQLSHILRTWPFRGRILRKITIDQQRSIQAYKKRRQFENLIKTGQKVANSTELSNDMIHEIEDENDHGDAHNKDPSSTKPGLGVDSDEPNTGEPDRLLQNIEWNSPADKVDISDKARAAAQVISQVYEGSPKTLPVSSLIEMLQSTLNEDQSPEEIDGYELQNINGEHKENHDDNKLLATSEDANHSSTGRRRERVGFDRMRIYTRFSKRNAKIRQSRTRRDENAVRLSYQEEDWKMPSGENILFDRHLPKNNLNSTSS